MIIIIAEEGKKIHLGRIGENEARAVRFDVSRILAEFPGASISVLNMRPSDPDAYPVNGQYIALDGSYLLWTLQSGDLTEDGLGECELKATLSGVIVKSIIWTTEICPALDGNGTPPEPWESWQQQVEDDADRAEAAAEDSEAWAIGERGGEPVAEGDETYHNNAKYWAHQAEETLASKADKVSGAQTGDIATLDSSGNLQSSGLKTGSFARKNNTVLDSTLSRGRKANTTAGTGSIAFGDNVEGAGPYSRAYGKGTRTYNRYSVAEGNTTVATGESSHAEGEHTEANHLAQHAFGRYNVPDAASTGGTYPGNFIEVVGNGSDESNRSNARTLDWQGNERLRGDLYVGANADGTGGTKVAKVTDIPEPVDISGKADKVAGAAAGNFAGLDAEGNLKDSGKAASDFVAAEDFRADEMPMSATDPKTVAQTTTELKSQIDGKADLIRDTVSNVPIASVPDAAANLPLTALRFAVEPIQAGSGDPYPAGGGKNKLKPISAGSGEISSVSYTAYDDGTIKINGTATGAHFNLYFFGSGSTYADLGIPSGEYKLNGIPSGSACTITLIDSDGNSQQTGAGNDKTIQIDDTKTYRLYLRLPIGSSATNEIIKPMIRLSSVADSTFAPYENKRPITGRTSAVVAVSGKNLIPNGTDTNKGYVAGSRLSTDGSLATFANMYVSEYFKVKAGETYTYSKKESDTYQRPAVCFYDENKTFISGAEFGSNVPVKVITTPSGAVWARATQWGTNTNLYQFEEGGTATDKTPYTGTQHPVQFGSTVHGGYIDWVNGAVVVDKAILTVDHQTSFDTANGAFYAEYVFPENITGTVLNAKNFLCNKYKEENSIVNSSAVSSRDDMSFFNQVQVSRPDFARRLFVKDSRFSTAAAFQASLENEPIVIAYPLPVPITISLSDLDEIRTVEGQNNVWADCGNVLELTYACDTKGYIDKKLAELTALVLET